MRKIAILGAGGAAKAAVYGLSKLKARILIFNRNVDKAKKMFSKLNCRVEYLGNLNDFLPDIDIIVSRDGDEDLYIKIFGTIIEFKGQNIIQLVLREN